MITHEKTVLINAFSIFLLMWSPPIYIKINEIIILILEQLSSTKPFTLPVVQVLCKSSNPIYNSEVMTVILILEHDLVQPMKNMNILS